MTGPARRSGFVYWARCRMRGLDRWCCQAIWWTCWVGIIAHWLIH